MRSLKRFALLVGIVIVGAPTLAYAWFVILSVIGKATDSGALGISGPYGPWGGALFLALLAGLIGAIPAAIVLARRAVDRFLPDILTFEHPNPEGRAPQ